MDRIRSIMAGVGDNDVKVGESSPPPPPHPLGVLIGAWPTQVNREMFPMETNVTVVLVTEATSTPEEMESFIRSTRQLRPDVKFVIQSGKARKVRQDEAPASGLPIHPGRRVGGCCLWSPLSFAGAGGRGDAQRVDQAPASLLGGRHVQRETRRAAAPQFPRLPQLTCGSSALQAGGSRATTGILATMVMLKQCKSVTLYGFGEPVKGQAFAPFHFYDVWPPAACRRVVFFALFRSLL